MSARKVTPWFGGDVKPVRAGVYERKIPDSGTAYWNFDGRHWNYGGDSTPTNVGSIGLAFNQNMPWRGLAADPQKGGR